MLWRGGGGDTGLITPDAPVRPVRPARSSAARATRVRDRIKFRRTELSMGRAMCGASARLPVRRCGSRQRTHARPHTDTHTPQVASGASRQEGGPWPALLLLGVRGATAARSLGGSEEGSIRDPLSSAAFWFGTPCRRLVPRLCECVYVCAPLLGTGRAARVMACR